MSRLRHQIRAEQAKDGRWRLAHFEPRGVGHHRVDFVGNESWPTKQSALRAKRERLRWVELMFRDGSKTGRQYHLKPLEESETSEKPVKTKRTSNDEQFTLEVDVDSKGLWRLFWVDEDGERAAAVGDPSIKFRKAPDPVKDLGKWESYMAEQAVRLIGASEDRDGFYWESERAGKGALRAARAAMAQKSTALPAWAIKAQAAGWTPPKGWKP